MALVNGTEYFYSIYFYDESGNYTRLDASAIPSVVISAPVLTGIVSGDFKFTVSWDKVMVDTNNVDSYVVYYGTAPGVYTYTQEVATTATGFDIESPSLEVAADVVNNVTYWVTVSAKYAGGESLKADPVLSVVPALDTGVPQPQNVYAIAGDAAFRIKWDNDTTVDTWYLRYGTDPNLLNTYVEIPKASVLIDAGDNMAYYDVSHVDGVTPVVNDNLYFVKMQAGITGIATNGLWSEVVTVYPQAGLVGFVDGLYSYSVPFYADVFGVPLVDADMATFADAAEKLGSSYVLYYDPSADNFGNYISGGTSNATKPIEGGTAYITGPSGKVGQNVIITGDEWSN